MRKPRWITERKYANKLGDHLQIITVHAEGETKELVKRENKNRTYKRSCVLI